MLKLYVLAKLALSLTIGSADADDQKYGGHFTLPERTAKAPVMADDEPDCWTEPGRKGQIVNVCREGNVRIVMLPTQIVEVSR